VGLTVGARLHALRRLTRFDNAVCAGGYTVLGGYLAAPSPDLPVVVRAALVVLSTVCFGNVINDYRDVAADKQMKPDRPLPAGLISLRAAAGIAAAFALGALLLAATLAPLLVGVAILAVLLSAGYSYGLKGTLLLGNVAVAVLVAATVFYGALAAGALNVKVGIACALIFVFSVAQEVLFNLLDEEGDRRAGVGTTAARLGPARTLMLYRALMLLFCAIAVATTLLDRVSITYAVLIVSFMVVPTLALLVMLRTPITVLKLRRAITFTRAVWLCGAVPLVVLAVQ